MISFFKRLLFGPKWSWMNSKKVFQDSKLTFKIVEGSNVFNWTVYLTETERSLFVKKVLKSPRSNVSKLSFERLSKEKWKQ